MAAQWIIGGALILIGGYISSFAIIRLIQNARNRKNGVDHHVSGMPLIGPLFFIAGWAISPLEWSNWALLVLAVDIDTTLLIVVVPFALIFKKVGGDEPDENESEREAD